MNLMQTFENFLLQKPNSPWTEINKTVFDMICLTDLFSLWNNQNTQ